MCRPPAIGHFNLAGLLYFTIVPAASPRTFLPCWPSLFYNMAAHGRQLLHSMYTVFTRWPSGLQLAPSWPSLLLTILIIVFCTYVLHYYLFILLLLFIYYWIAAAYECSLYMLAAGWLSSLLQAFLMAAWPSDGRHPLRHIIANLCVTLCTSIILILFNWDIFTHFFHFVLYTAVYYGVLLLIFIHCITLLTYNKILPYCSWMASNYRERRPSVLLSLL